MKVSVVIPCYNDGEYLPEAVESVEKCNKDSYEIIIVNDGSIDQKTVEVIESMKRRGCRVFHIGHRGQSAARNFGAMQAKYDYILFLDSDNKIYPEYLHAGAQILDENPEVGAVFGDKKFFGLENDLRIQPDFDLHEAFFIVIFDMCSVIRKKMWQDCGGLDEEMDFYEDWEFFINASERNWKFFHIKKPMFDYRVRAESVNAKRFEKDNRLRIMSYVYLKHFNFFLEVMDDIVVKYGLKGKIHIIESIVEHERINARNQQNIANEALCRAEQEKIRAEQERNKANEALCLANEEKNIAEQERKKADNERNRANEAISKANENKKIADGEKIRVEQEIQKNHILQKNIEEFLGDIRFAKKNFQEAEEIIKTLTEEKTSLLKTKDALEEIQNSITWRIFKKFHKIFDFFVPEKTPAGIFYRNLLLQIRKNLIK